MKFTRTQTIILLVLGLLTFSAMAGMAGIVIVSTLNPPALPAEVTPTATGVPHDPAAGPPTWTPTPTPTITPTPPGRIERTPTPTNTPRPTNTPSPTPTPQPTPTPITPQLINPGFDMLMTNRIPGWKWYAFVNYRSGQEAPPDPDTSFAEPFFSAADDAARQISGSTLKIETERWLRFRAWVHQSVTVTAGSTLYFEIRAGAYSSLDRLIVRAGIDPTGQDNCQQAQWGEEMWINQDSGIVRLTSPRVVVPPLPVEELPEEPPEEPPDDPREEPPDEPSDDEEEAPPVANLGHVTVCFSAEPSYPHVNNAAFFDDARLVLVP